MQILKSLFVYPVAVTLAFGHVNAHAASPSAGQAPSKEAKEPSKPVVRKTPKISFSSQITKRYVDCPATVIKEKKKKKCLEILIENK